MGDRDDAYSIRTYAAVDDEQGVENSSTQLTDPLMRSADGQQSNTAAFVASSGSESKLARENRRHTCRDPFSRLWYTISGVSLFVNLALGGLIVYYMVVVNGGGPVGPPPKPATQTNCSLSSGTAIQANQMNSTSMHVCWSPINVTSTRVYAPYVLRLSDWFTNTSSYVAYSGTNTSVVFYDLIPNIIYNISVERYIDIGVDPIVSNMSLMLNSSNDAGCSSYSDLNFLKTHRSTAKKMIQQCLVDSAGLPSFAVPCMVAHGMSQNCSKCWYNEGLCTLAKCFSPCSSNPQGDECKSCSEEMCFPACVDCSHVPRWVFPP